MKIIALTDLHNRVGFGPEAGRSLAEADIIIISGDLTRFQGRDIARAVLEPIRQINANLLAVPGNCDRTEVNDYLTELDINLHGQSRIINRIAFYGLGGSSVTPFMTPQEFSEEEIAGILAKFAKIPDAAYHVLVTHAPPHGTLVDQAGLGNHAGSKAVRDFINSFQPDLCLCGHIHEAIGSDRLGKTIIINPGPFPQHYALVEINQGISCRLT